MSKKKNITLVVILLLATNILTFGITNMVSIKYSDKVIVPRSEYEELNNTYKKYAKAIGLENYAL